MQYRVTGHVIGLLCLFLALAMLVPALLGVADGDGSHIYFLVSAAISGITGAALYRPGVMRRNHLGLRERMMTIIH